ncbi:hypothetical protein PR202_ga02281 [Eleusine coracana subsp. coracana]|uniref:Uncharacterized protein n=1 Tax=Eleusine coracana subsp. coracana TaxID=191504 RepID=A0AAV5BMD1_ELECO|nr:hypothetical protein PR202_ga02281 [Eleusine coracana subsp. coracana]
MEDISARPTDVGAPHPDSSPPEDPEVGHLDGNLSRLEEQGSRPPCPGVLPVDDELSCMEEVGDPYPDSAPPQYPEPGHPDRALSRLQELGSLPRGPSAPPADGEVPYMMEELGALHPDGSLFQELGDPPPDNRLALIDGAIETTLDNTNDEVGSVD